MIRGFEQSCDFLFGGFVENERATIICGFWNAEYAPARFGAGQEVASGIERQRANVGLFAGIKDLALAIRRDRENLSGIAGGYVHGSIFIHGKVPNVFGLRVVKNGGLAARRH